MLDLSGVPAARWRVAARVAALHLGVSALIATAIAVIVVKVWFPYPFGELAGGLRLLWMIVAVDVVCGPALMLLLYSPSKTRRALAVDITLIVGLQAAALGYGAHTLAQARPLALVFEVDRFRVVSYADIPAASLPAAPAWVNPWSLGSPRVLAIRRAASLDEKISSISASLAGVEPSVQPDWCPPGCSGPRTPCGRPAQGLPSEIFADQPGGGQVRAASRAGRSPRFQPTALASSRGPSLPGLDCFSRPPDLSHQGLYAAGRLCLTSLAVPDLMCCGPIFTADWNVSS